MFAHTKTGIVQPKTISFEWKVENFLANCQEPGDYHMSPVFPINYCNQITELYLMVYPKGEKEDRYGRDDVYLRFSFDSENEIKMKVDVQVSIVSERNVSRECKNVEAENKTFSLGWPQFASHSDVKHVLINDTLTILCKVVFQPMRQDLAKNVYSYSDWLNKIKNGFADYEELLESGNFSDVTFNLQNKQINAHKAILSCRSPVFKAMFENEMQEKKQNSVEITDVDYDVMKELLRFLYSGKVKNIKEIASELLIAADKYQVIELKALCEKTLYDSRNNGNVVEYLKLTEMCDTIHLRRLVIKYVAAHYEDIIEKPGFADLPSKVMLEILQAIAKDKRNFQIF